MGSLLAAITLAFWTVGCATLEAVGRAAYEGQMAVHE